MINPSHTELAARARDYADRIDPFKRVGLDNLTCSSAADALRQCAAALEAHERGVQGEAYKLSDEDINEGAERHGITVAGPRLDDFDAGVRWAELALSNPPDARTPPTAPDQDAQGVPVLSLQPVIQWLEAGCEPKHAATELRLLCAAAPSPQASEGGVELTNEQILDLWDEHTVPVFGRVGYCPIVFARKLIAALRASSPAERVPSNLHTFLNAAAGEGLVLHGVDAADLYVELFPKTYARIVTKEST